MTITVAIRDETSSGTVLHQSYVNLLSARTTAREIIRERIFQEVNNYNRRPSLPPFRSLIAPTETEILLNSSACSQTNRLDSNEQCEIAYAAFERNRFLVLVDEQQMENLDDEISIHANTTVSFLKLVALVGG